MPHENGRPAPPAAADDSTAGALEEYLAAVASGAAPPRAQFLARHPELAEDLDACLAALYFIGQAAEGPRSVPAGLAQVASPEPAAGQLGDFRLVREVGRGGMGVVYEAEQISLGRRVALKVLPFAATMDPRQLQRFHNEARAAASLDHPHIVHVHAVGCERAVHFYAMQYIEGQTLAALIADLRQAAGRPARPEQPPTAPHTPGQPEPGAPAADTAPRATASTERGPLDQAHYRRVAELGVQAAEALDHAHALGVVHRDVKPANLLLDGRGGLWVTDFGLAHIQSDARLTMTGDLVGTLRYMSPEQALAKRVVVDHRTDVYSLGATLYELLTLEPAFAGNDRQELLRQIAFEEPARPRRLSKAIPAELETVVLKAMEKNPAERYATAGELAEDLRRFLADKPIRARPAGVARRLRKWGRRHRAGVTAAIVGLVLTLTGVAGSVGWAVRDQEARRSATARAVAALHEESASWQASRRVPEALSAARRANGLLTGVDADEALRQRARARLADLELLERLENIRLEKMTEAKDGGFDDKGADDLYGQTFRAAGLDVEALPVTEAAERIRRSTVAIELAAMLDQWAMLRRTVKREEELIMGKEDPSWRHLLRVARLADPDVWRTWLRKSLERRDWKALRAAARGEEAVHLPVATLLVLGLAITEQKTSDHLTPRDALDQAEALLRKAQRRHPNDFWLNYWLSVVAISACSPHKPPQWEESIRFATAAVALRPESPRAHMWLAFLLRAKGQLDEAIAEHREAIRLKKDYSWAHHDLACTLDAKGRLDEAIAAYREAIRLKNDCPATHQNLVSCLARNGRLNEAVAAYREAIQFTKGIEAHRSFTGFLLRIGAALRHKGQLDDAIACYKEAIQLNQDYAEAHCDLGDVLEQKGLFAEALVHRRRGHELGSRNPRWPYPSAGWVRNCERLVELDEKLPAVLSGMKQPADAAERLGLAFVCQLKKRYAAALRFYTQAFAEQPQRADDLSAHHRYNAACVAALAGCGQGKDAGALAEQERASWRRQARDWLRADLARLAEMIQTGNAQTRQAVEKTLQHWLRDPDFNGVRGPEALGKLPQAERQAWSRLWADVAATLARTQGQRTPEAQQASPAEGPKQD